MCCSFLGSFWGDLVCDVFVLIVDAVCDGICEAAKVVLEVVKQVLHFVESVVEIAKQALEGITEWFSKAMEALFPVKQFSVDFKGNADLSLRKQSSVSVDVSRNFIFVLVLLSLF